MIHLDFRSNKPIYEQIIQQYKYLIIQKFIKKGDAIPSVRKLAMTLNVTPGTVAKAYRELEQQGIIETIRGKGTFVAGVPDIQVSEGVLVKVTEELKNQCMELVYLGMSKEDVLKLMEEAYDSISKERCGKDE